ncbi:hypothetical protein B296_00007345 [Ensete ventricosum]|uniref:Uncharacterized protein n=1 Tax=Ensete ventricosum TaxID=4639 RepID=A0A426ZU91_ENSVE|nr:hypothetical protein B296_00007345 [Ensete ventricosum]
MDFRAFMMDREGIGGKVLTKSKESRAVKKMGDVPLDEDVAVGIGEENGQYHLADRIGWKKKTAPASFLPAAVGSIVRCPFSESRSGFGSEARRKTVGPWALERTSPHTPPLFGLVVH